MTSFEIEQAAMEFLRECGLLPESLRPERGLDPHFPMNPQAVRGGTRDAWGRPVEYARENVTDRYSWLDPEGNFYPIAGISTHETWAMRNGLDSLQNAFKKGWHRVIYVGRDLITNNPHFPPNSKQRNALKDLAIMEKMDQLIHDTDEDERVLWRNEDDSPSGYSAQDDRGQPIEYDETPDPDKLESHPTSDINRSSEAASIPQSTRSTVEYKPKAIRIPDAHPDELNQIHEQLQTFQPEELDDFAINLGVDPNRSEAYEDLLHAVLAKQRENANPEKASTATPPPAGSQALRINEWLTNNFDSDQLGVFANQMGIDVRAPGGRDDLIAKIIENQNAVPQPGTNPDPQEPEPEEPNPDPMGTRKQRKFSPLHGEDNTPIPTAEHSEHLAEPQRAYMSASPITNGIRFGNGVNETWKVDFPDNSMGIFKPSLGEAVSNPFIPQGGSYKREVMGSVLGDILGMPGLVPSTTFREFDGKKGSVQQFVPSLQASMVNPDFKFDGQEGATNAAILDYLTGNSDRHGNNWHLDYDGNLVLIDNGTTFPTKYHAGSYKPYTHMEFVRNAVRNDLPLPDMRHLQPTWPRIEEQLRTMGIEDNAIKLARRRFADLTSGQYQSFRDLPAFWGSTDTYSGPPLRDVVDFFR